MKATVMIDPPVERRVVLNISEAQAQTLRSILGQSNCDAHGLYDMYKALADVFPENYGKAEGWAIRNPQGHIAP